MAMAANIFWCIPEFTHTHTLLVPAIHRTLYSQSLTHHYAIGKFAAEHGIMKTSKKYKLRKKSVRLLKHL